jgi:hypothetical protein
MQKLKTQLHTCIYIYMVPTSAGVVKDHTFRYVHNFFFKCWVPVAYAPGCTIACRLIVQPEI